MKEQDFETFAGLMAAVCEYYRVAKLSDLAVEMYFGGLVDFSIDEVQRGLSMHMGNPDVGQYFPKAADVRRALLGGSETHADRAWAKVYEAICRVGHMPSVAFDDAIIHAVIADMGGWVKLALVGNDELPFRERDFLRLYRGYAGRPPQEYPRYLPGLAETENFGKGYAVEPPLLLGDAAKAQQVLLAGSDKPRLAVQPMQALPEAAGGMLRHDGERGGLRRIGVEVPA